MRRYELCIFVSLLGAALQGCATQPLPQDVTGSNTSNIVARIRCETRDAIRAAAIKEIETYKNHIIYGNLTGYEFGAQLRNDPSIFERLGSPRFKQKNLDKAFEYFRKAQVAYEFTLNLNESNTQGINLDIVKAFARRTDTIGIGSRGERTRQTIRRFTVTDNFLILATKINPEYCSENSSNNLIYPIEGRLKIADLIDNFIFINKYASLEGTPKGPAIPEMNDTIVFSTKFSGNISPSVALTTAPFSGFELSRLSVANDNFREDRHQVIITATLPNIQDFPYFSGIKSLKFRDNDRRLIVAVDSIERTRQKNVEDSLLAISNSISQTFGR